MSPAPSGGWLGAPLLRREDERFVTGRGRYVADVDAVGVLTATFVRSPVAAATGLRVDLAPARSAPGVVAAFAAADLGLDDIPGSTGRGPDAPAMSRPPLARHAIRHVGEPLALILTEGSPAGADAVELVGVDFDTGPVVADIDAALADDDLVFAEAGTNVVHSGTVPQGSDPDLERWPVRARVLVDNQRLAPVSIEPLAILAVPEPGGGVTVWCGHQAPHRLRDQLARHIGLEPGAVRVVVPDVGGAFGMKGMLFPEYLVVVAAALRTGRPVRWVQTRYEQFVCGTHGRGMRHEVELSGDADGRIRAARVRIRADLGAYPHNGGAVPWFSRYMASGPYDIADLSVEVTMVVTNRAPTGSYRGAGRPEAALAIERGVEAFARAAGLDPAVVRRRNFVPASSMPHTTPTGALYDSGDYTAALDRALALAGEPRVREEQARRRDSGGHPLGLGIGSFVERAGGAKDSGEYARVEVSPDGRVIARTGTSSTGQGHETTWSQVVASVLGVAPDEVTVVAGDTAAVSHGTGSFASRSAQLAGSALMRTATAVRERARGLAADLLDVPESDVVLLPGGGFGAGPRRPGHASLAEVAHHAGLVGTDLAAEETFTPGAQTFPYGCCVAVVEVDVETGRVRILDLVAVDDCGTVLNPMLVEGQVHGSLLQGVAQALFEGIEYDVDAQPLTTTLADYGAPAAPDAPSYTTDRLVSPAPSNPLGAKGAGESGCIGAPPAVVNAVLDALAPYGVTDLQMPMTPQSVWHALRKAHG